MSRTIKEIYNLAITERNKRLELSEFNNDSKMSIMNALTWVVSAVIHSFEVILDVFAIDISTNINNRINGTPQYYANALLQYQHGDSLMVREDGLAFGYPVVDESKRIITQVTYIEVKENDYLDTKLVLKVAQGDKGNLSALSAEDLVLVNQYVNQIKFAGTRIEVISRKGDILVPRLTVYYDGAILESEMYDNIEAKLNEYIMNIEFDAGIYVSKVLDAIQSAEHVIDVYVESGKIPEQGVFMASYDSDGQLQALEKIDRKVHPNSGYIKQSTGKDQEKDIPNFRQAIKLVVENNEV